MNNLHAIPREIRHNYPESFVQACRYLMYIGYKQFRYIPNRDFMDVRLNGRTENWVRDIPVNNYARSFIENEERYPDAIPPFDPSMVTL